MRIVGHGMEYKDESIFDVFQGLIMEDFESHGSDLILKPPFDW